MKKRTKQGIKYTKKGLFWGGILLLTWGIISMLPLWRLFRPGWIFQRHLVVIMNEAEARPCGGFITAYGVIEPWKLSANINNSYTLTGQTFRPAPDIMNDFVSELSFWDLNTQTNTQTCRTHIKEAYAHAFGESIGKVHFVNIEGVLPVIKTMAPIKYGNTEINESNFFATLSRTVSNTDRHDEGSLATRKGPLAEIGKNTAKKIIFTPWKWPQISHKINKAILTNTIDIENISPKINGGNNTFGLVEWNLGGAKSSRYLEKQFDITYREKNDKTWEIQVQVDLHHTGQTDEPLSQDWKGKFEVLFPEFLRENAEIISLELKPGDTYKKEFTFIHKGNLPQNKITFFQPRMSDTFVHINVSLYPQQSIKSSDFEKIKEYTASYKATPSYGRTQWTWDTEKDSEGPFITIHTLIPANIRNKYPAIGYPNIVAELHLNEEVQIIEDEFYAELFDRNYTNNTHQNMLLTSYVLLEDKKTLLLGFNNKLPQPEERYFLQIEGIKDLWGNPIQQGQRTLIDRVNQ